MAAILVETVGVDKEESASSDPAGKLESSKIVSKAPCIGVVCIDCQDTFGHRTGSMYCSGGIGGEAAMRNGGYMISHNIEKINRLMLSGDDHPYFQIGCITWFENMNHDHPKDFSIISVKDFEEGVWRCTLPQYQDWTLYYLREIESKGKKHLVCPVHATKNSPSAAFVEPIQFAKQQWEAYHRKEAMIIRKGICPRVEQYSAVRAEVVDPNDSTTSTNELFLHELSQCHKIAWMGLARNFCLGFSLLDVLDLNPKLIERCTLIADATADVKGYEAQGDTLIKKLRDHGMTISTSQDWFVQK